MLSRPANSSAFRLGLVLALTSAVSIVRAQELALSASPSGLVDNTAEIGAPLLVTVRVDAPPEAGRPVPLVGTPADWRQAVTVELLRSADNSVVARAQPVGTASDGAAQVDPETGLSGRWLIPADAFRSASAGEYLLRTTLLPGAAGEQISTWRFTLVSSQEPRGDAGQRSLIAASAAAAAGDAARARSLLNDALRADPDRYDLLIARGQLALSEGDRRVASFCLRRAAALVARGSGEPPASLYSLAEELRAVPAEGAAVSGNSGSIDLPPAVLEPVAPVAANAVRTTKGTVVTRPSSMSEKIVAPAPSAARPSAAAAGSRPASSSSAPTASGKSNPPASSPVPASSASGVAQKSPAANASPAASAAGQSAASVAPAVAGPGKLIPSADLADARITADPRGRWAAEATASSSYGKIKYGPQQATGAPNVTVAGDSPNSWCAGRQSGGEEWLEVAFAEPAAAIGVRVRQNNAPGTICRIEAIDDSGATHLWWSGRDPLPPATVRQITWFGVDVPATEYRVARVRITLDVNVIPGWKEIDAVQLVTTVH